MEKLENLSENLQKKIVVTVHTKSKHTGNQLFGSYKTSL